MNVRGLRLVHRVSNQEVHCLPPKPPYVRNKNQNRHKKVFSNLSCGFQEPFKIEGLRLTLTLINIVALEAWT